jgi:hypothetical protein
MQEKDNGVPWVQQNGSEGFLSPAAKPSGKTGLITSVTLVGNHNVSYKESSGEHLSSSNRSSQCQEKVFDCFGHLGCPRLTLYEEVTQPESPQKECRGVCPNISRMPVSVQDGRAVTVALNPPGVPIGHHPARALSPSGRSKSMETSIGHRHE